MLKKITFAVLIFILVLIFSGCGAKRQVNEMAYAVGLGIDKGKNKPLSVSLQFAKPMAVSGEEESGENGEKTENAESTSLISVEAEDIFSAIKIIEGSLSKQINLTHVKLLLFSEELAKEGISGFAEALMANSQFRPSTYIAVSLCGAREYFYEVKPVLELNPAKYYTLVFSKKAKSFVPEATLRDFYFNINSMAKDTVMPTVGENEEGAQKAGENKTDVLGVALFKGDKLKQTLKTDMGEIYNMLTGDFAESFYSLQGAEKAAVKLKVSKKPKIMLKKNGNAFTAEIKLFLSAEAAQCENKELLKNNAAPLKKAVEESLKNKAEEFMSKNKEQKCDAVGIGKKAKRFFKTQEEWENYGFKEKLSQINVNFDVNVNITGTGLVQNR